MDYTVSNTKKFSLSGSALKIIAVVSMIIDHVAGYLLNENPFFTQTLGQVADITITPVYVMRAVGRLAFPLFCFLLVQGFEHTHDRKRYGLYLLAFALISEIPFDWMVNGGWDMKSQNVFFSLLFGYIGMNLCSVFKTDRFNLAMAIIMLSVVVIFFGGDYGLEGFLFIMLLYIFRRWRCTVIPVCTLLPMGWAAIFSFIPIMMYDGTRGFIRKKQTKYMFYMFYPAHIMVICLLKILYY